jgi:hypothetical protein
MVDLTTPVETDPQARARLTMDYPKEIRPLLRELYDTYRQQGLAPGEAFTRTLRDYDGPLPLDRSRWQGTRPEYIHICEECDALFIGAKHARLCGEKSCEMRRYRRNLKTRQPPTRATPKTCPVCRESFTPTRKTQKVCANARCRDHHYRRFGRYAPKPEPPKETQPIE